jgi:GWxTD domain-containing protein
VDSTANREAASGALGRGFLLSLLLAVAFGPSREARARAAGAEQAILLPAKSSGDLLYYFDLASFPSRPGPARSEIYLRLPGDELVYADSAKAGGAAGTASVHVKLRARNARGKTALELERDLAVPAAERDAKGFSLGHVVLLPVTLPSGWCEIRLEVSDLRSQKRGLAYVGQKAHHTGKIEGTVFVPTWDPAGLLLSQIEPAWSIRKGGSRGPFARADVDVLPDPSRTYGLYASTVRAYYELAFGDSGAPVITARVLDLKGKVLLTAEPDTARSGAQWGQVAFDVSTLPAGAYDLEVALASGATRAVRSTRFNVAWRPGSWQGDPRELFDEAHLLLDDAEKENDFARLTIGEQEAYLDAYWAEHDPTPGTALNEERERFYQRVDYANKNFGTAGIEKGMDSDRGRTYIRYGEPDEIRREVMPTNGLQVDDIAKAVAEENGLEEGLTLKGRGAGADMRSFEIWTYDLLVHPRGDAAKDLGPRHPVKRIFVFVDEEGYGNYVLRYTND